MSLRTKFKYQDYWPNREFSYRRYVDDVFEPPFNFEYHLESKGSLGSIIEYENDLVTYSKQKITQFSGAKKNWSSSALKPAKDFSLNESGRMIIIDEKAIFPTRKKILCFNLKTHEILWELESPSFESLSKFEWQADSINSKEVNFHRVVYIDDTFIYFKNTLATILKVNHLEGTFEKYLNVRILNNTITNSDRVYGGINKDGAKIDRNQFGVYNIKKEKLELFFELDILSGCKYEFIKDNILVASNGYAIFCLKIDKKVSLVWEKEIEGRFLCADNECMYFVGNKLLCFSIMTCELLWENNYSEIDIENLFDSEKVFVDNKYLHGSFYDSGHATIDKKTGELIYTCRWYRGDSAVQDYKDGTPFEGPSEIKRYCYHLFEIIPGENHLYYSLFSRPEFIRLIPSNK